MNFCLYLKNYDEFESYFKRRKHSNVNHVTLRYETGAGKQAQLDWKESITFRLKNGENVVVNVLFYCCPILDLESIDYPYQKLRIYCFSFSRFSFLILSEAYLMK